MIAGSSGSPDHRRAAAQGSSDTGAGMEKLITGCREARCPASHDQGTDQSQSLQGTPCKGQACTATRSITLPAAHAAQSLALARSQSPRRFWQHAATGAKGTRRYGLNTWLCLQKILHKFNLGAAMCCPPVLSSTLGQNMPGYSRNAPAARLLHRGSSLTGG